MAGRIDPGGQQFYFDVRVCIPVLVEFDDVSRRLEVGTVVAFVSGLAKVNEPWRDVVAWYREMSAVDMRYRLVADAIRGLEKKEDTPA